MRFLSVCATSLALLVTLSAQAEDYRPLDWDDLLPEGAVYEEPEPDHNDPFGAVQSTFAEVDEALDGQNVKLPGFVVPLEGDERTLTSFLLVPYFGACIHVPPPPPNQIVHVDYPSGAPIGQLWDAIWVSGTLRTEASQNEMADVSYRLEGIRIEPYSDEDAPEYEDPWD